jgi:hypothetical protein
MKMLTARVVGGHLDLPQGALEEGALVTLLVQEPDEDFHLSEEQRLELVEALAEAKDGEGVDGWRLLEELRGG